MFMVIQQDKVKLYEAMVVLVKNSEISKGIKAVGNVTVSTKFHGHPNMVEMFHSEPSTFTWQRKKSGDC